MTIEKKLEKRIATIVQATGEFPREIEITKEDYEELLKELHCTEISKFRNVKLKIKE